MDSQGCFGVLSLRRAVVVSVLAAMMALLAPTSALAATFNPVADSYVDGSAPTANNGTKTSIRTDASPVVNSYLRFNVIGLGAPAAAQLRVYAETNSSTGFQVRPVTGPGANTWGETAINFNNAPPLGSVIGTSGPVTAGRWYTIDLPSLVSGDGLVSVALTSASTTATRYTSREGTNGPQLIAPTGAPGPGPDPGPAPDPGPGPGPVTGGDYFVTRNGSSYQATRSGGGTSFTGTAKSVVESAVGALGSGGGVITFGSGIFDLGDSWFSLKNVSRVTFQGQGMDVTVIQNNSSQAADTEPFNTSTTDHVVIRDMTVRAGGPVRTTSDAIDMDGGNFDLIERVKVSQSRGRGIVFDGKDIVGGVARTADNNIIRDCVITGVSTHGIQFLASRFNRVEGCTITNTTNYGVQITKSSDIARQPNKKSNGNVITGNFIDNAGTDGIQINSSHDNQILNNTITNSGNVTASKDGIKLVSSGSHTCDNNRISGNRATDNQSTKTQRYGLYISSANCHGTIAGPGNDFSGNLSGPFKNSGTGTIFQ